MSKNKVKKPLTRGVAKVPVVMQMEALECGAAALTMVMAYYEKWVPLEQVRQDCGVSRDGSNAKNIVKAAEYYGFKVTAKYMSPESVRKNAIFPAIIHWNMNHFVVLDGFRGNHVYLNDPARGNVKVSWEEFDNSFTGIIMMPEPSDSFVPGGKRKSMLDFAKKRLIGTGAAVAFVILATAISYMLGIANSITSRIFLDRLLPGVNPEWLYPFIGIMLLIALIQIVVAWVQAINSLKINGKMSAAGSISYMWKVLRLPMAFFSQRMTGDIQGRLELNAAIAGTLVNTFGPIVINMIIMVVYLVLMLKQSLILTAVGLVTIVINFITSRIIAAKRINITRVQMRDQGLLISVSSSGFSMIETIKASGAENGFFQKWAGYQASVNTQGIKSEKMNQFLGSIPAFLVKIANYAVLVIGVWLTIQGKYTLGGVMMFQGLLENFMTPAATLVSAGQSLQEMRTQMERVEDVMEYPDDVNVQDEKTELGDNPSKLKGNIEMKNLTFGYSPLEDPLITDFSLSLKTGQRVALVGASGSGKSTVSKMISGLYEPWSGEILFDGKPRSAYPREILTSSLAVVDQDITIFEDTISNNIRMWDDTIMDFEVILAARDAQIHDDITKLPGGYQQKLVSGGQNLSGGQRQRLEIARVLAQDPSIIILDEATSALDAKTENEVMKAIVARGITCIVIAHRLSTVRDCDEIIVLDHGKVKERGTHQELMQLGGMYAALVSND